MNQTLLITRNFPPGLGGTCTLYSNLYHLFPKGCLTVLTDRHVRSRDFDRAFPHPIERMDLSLRPWTKPFEWVELGLRMLGPVHRLIRTRTIDEIHCATTFPEGITGWAAKVLFRKRMILWVTGEDAESFRHYRVEGPLQRRMIASADRIIAISQNTARICQELGASDSQLRLVLPGVDLSRFVPSPEAGRQVRKRWGCEAFPLLVTIARLHRRKGQDKVIEALPIVRQRFPNVQYLIVGDSSGAPPEDAEWMRQRVRELHLEEIVHFVGAVPGDELAAYYSAADLFVMPNRQIGGDVEGYGLTFLEAAACGKTSIAGRSGGAVNAVLHNQTGWLVDGDDHTDVAAGILTVLADDSLRCRLEISAQAHVKNLAWSSVYQRFHEAIRD